MNEIRCNEALNKDLRIEFDCILKMAYCNSRVEIGGVFLARICEPIHTVRVFKEVMHAVKQEVNLRGFHLIFVQFLLFVIMVIGLGANVVLIIIQGKNIVMIVTHV